MKELILDVLQAKYSEPLARDILSMDIVSEL
jgi:hypothetical protein